MVCVYEDTNREEAVSNTEPICTCLTANGSCYKHFNREKKTAPQKGKYWCYGCDRALVNKGSKCPVCGQRDKSKHGKITGTDDGRVVSNFIMQALQGKSLTVFGDGKQTRSFQFVDDLIKGLYVMMEQDDFVGPVNIGNPEEFTVLDLAKKVKFLTKSDSEIIFKPLPKDDPLQRCPDISLAKQKLGWTPNVRLEQGLVKTIEYFRKY